MTDKALPQASILVVLTPESTFSSDHLVGALESAREAFLASLERAMRLNDRDDENVTVIAFTTPENATEPATLHPLHLRLSAR